LPLRQSAFETELHSTNMKSKRNWAIACARDVPKFDIVRATHLLGILGYKIT